jgi:glycosyltransferase involved in cell wall biosynthesis
MCTWNGAAYLEEQLASIVAQTRKPDELVICDDASDDSTPRVLERFSVTAPFSVRIHRNRERLGSTKNFEQAIRRCTGDVIFLSDQDDVWRPEKIAAMAERLTRDIRIGCLFTDAARIDASGKPLPGTLWDHIGFDESERGRVHRTKAFDVLIRHNVATGATMAFRAKWRDMLLPIPEEIVHDRWIALILAALGRLDCIETPLIAYRVHPRQHIGPGQSAAGIDRWIEMSRETGAAEWTRRAKELTTVLRKLESIEDVPRRRVVQLRKFIAHMETRAALPSQRWRRVPVILRELATFRYFRHSRHFFSAAKDFLWRVK